MYLFDNLRTRLNYLEDKQIEQIYHAFLFANEAHQDQVRKSGEPYFTHPVTVAMILAAMRLDHQSIIAALLHDVVEDTDIKKNIIEAKFGNIVATLVDGVTKLSQIEELTHAEAQAESFRKMVLAMSLDIRVILIKLADRLHNIQTLQALPTKKRHRIAKETLEIYAPLANRLGMHLFCTELEELSFAVCYPKRYRILYNEIEKIRKEYKPTINMLENEFQQKLIKDSFPQAVVFAREKHLYGMYKKMQRFHSSFHDASNMYAFRIIVDDIESCYRALGAIHSIYKPIPGKFSDYIAIPKFNGYQSLHTFLFGPKGVPIEVQIRTPTMDRIANYGIVATWMYKNQNTIDSSQIHTQKWIGNLLEMQKTTGDSLEFIENVKSDLFPEEIYVFTPRGNIVELPKGATVIDFAYMVHTDIGNSCVAAKIDHKFVPLSNVLKSGQTVSIIAMEGAKPNPAWLNFAVTGKARSGIRDFLKNQKRSEAIEFGKQLLRKYLADLGTSLEEIPEQSLYDFLTAIHLKTLEDLYEDVGLGNRIAMFIAHQLLNIKSGKGIVREDSGEITVAPLLIKGAEGMAINFASCCYPIPGDSIIGYLQAGYGLAIHRKNCPHFARLPRRQETFIPVLWASEISGEFHATINIEVINQRGMLTSLAQAVTAAESNIDDIRVKERSLNYSFITIIVSVKNNVHLERVLRHINHIPGIISANRKED